MAKKNIINNLAVYTIISADGKTQASFVPEKGGIGSSLIMPHGEKARELYYQFDYFWDLTNPNLPGGMPFLFPVCARIARNGKMGDYLYDGNIYNLPIHGLAFYYPWEVAATEQDDRILLVLEDNKDTLKKYPFKFRIELLYQVRNKQLICEQKYINKSERPMPYYSGFHPYFVTPQGQGKEKVILDYKPVVLYQANETLTDIIGEQKLYEVPISVADPRIREQLTRLGAEHSYTLHYPDGFDLWVSTKAKDAGPEFPYIQIYTEPDLPFICVEPWMSFTNAMNTVAGVRWLAPHQEESSILSIEGQ